jgi:sugar phosphate isomerase/epimerase
VGIYLSYNQITAQTRDTELVIRECAKQGISHVGIWRDRFIASSVDRTRQTLDAHGIVASSLCRGGFFTGDHLSLIIEDNLRAIDEACRLRAPVLVLVCGPLIAPGTDVSISRIKAAVSRLLPVAASVGVTLAIEPFHPMLITERSAIVSLEQAVALVSEFDSPALGLALDAYHLWWDPNLTRSIQAARGRIALVQVGDWMPRTSYIMNSRGMPGEGVIDFEHFMELVQLADYAGAVEVEVLGPQAWVLPLEASVRLCSQWFARCAA